MGGNAVIPPERNSISRRSTRSMNENTAPRAIGKPRKGPRPWKRYTEVPEFEHFLFVPNDDDTTGDLKPASELPEKVLSHVQDALQGLLKPRLDQVKTITTEKNSNTYVNRGNCIGRFIYQRTRKDTCPHTVACPSYTKIDGRPCVRLETHPSEGKTVLVFYARPAHSRDRAIWNDWQFWLGSQA